MVPSIPFTPMPKIPRLNRPVIVTEKIDGTNASIFIPGDGHIYPASRNRWLSLDNDNMGFARWVYENKDQLLALGPGHHFGEWWGSGIQRRYGLDHKRFSLFNVSRWCDAVNPVGIPMGKAAVPPCCTVVPVLGMEDFGSFNAASYLEALCYGGSVAAPGFMQPEGIVAFHQASGQLFKATCENDATPKSNIGAT